MLLITEQNFNDIGYLIEETKQGKKMFFEGIFIQSNIKNRNGRIYEDRILKPVIEKYVKEYVNTGSAGGELNHPARATIDPERVCHRITELRWDGDNVYGKALVLNTPMGNIVKGLIEGGFRLGVSSRGMGSLKDKNGIQYVQDDFMLTTIDCVSDPSAPSAFVNGILEGVEFIYDSSGKLVQHNVEIFEKNAINKIKRNGLSESAQLLALKLFLSKL